MFPQARRVPTIHYVGNGSLLAVLLIGGSIVERPPSAWPLGLTTLVLTAALLLLAAVTKRLLTGTAVKPFRPGVSSRSVLHGRIAYQPNLITSPYTGRKGVALGIGGYSHGMENFLVGNRFRVVQADGTSVDISWPGARRVVFEGPRMRIRGIDDDPAIEAFWKEAWPRILGKNDDIDRGIAVAYEYCFAPGDEVCIAGAFARVRYPDGSVAYRPTLDAGPRELVFGIGSPRQVQRLNRGEFFVLIGCCVGAGLVWELTRVFATV